MYEWWAEECAVLSTEDLVLIRLENGHYALRVASMCLVSEDLRIYCWMRWDGMV
jgi:hypothetical protein